MLIVSMYAEDQFAIRCLRAGADGYLSKLAILWSSLQQYEPWPAAQIHYASGIGDVGQQSIHTGRPQLHDSHCPSASCRLCC